MEQQPEKQQQQRQHHLYSQKQKGLYSFLHFLRPTIKNLTLNLMKLDKPVDNIYIDLNFLLNEALTAYPIKGTIPQKDEINNIVVELEKILSDSVTQYKPKNMVYIALDGTLPRANLPFYRQYANIHDLDELFQIKHKKTVLERWQKEKKDLTPEILNFAQQEQTLNFQQPGTEFIHIISERIRAFIQKQMEVNWKHLKVIFSDDKVPNEAIYKFYECIRSQARSETYNPNTNHFVISSDADAVMCAIPLYKIHIYVSNNPTNIGYIINIGEIHKFLTMRHLHGIENKELAQSLKQTNVKEKIFYDFVLIFQFFGNQFIPSLPQFVNKKKSMSEIMDAYKKFLEKFRYQTIVTEDFHISLPNLQKFMHALFLHEFEQLSTQTMKLHTVHSSEYTERSNKIENISSINRDDKTDLENFNLDLDLLYFEKPQIDKFQLLEDFVQDSNNYNLAYYQDRFNLEEEPTTEFIFGLCQNYIEGIYFSYEYFARGVVSNNWTYKYLYAPFAKDLQLQFEKFQFPVFEKGASYTPFFQQLFTFSGNQRRDLLPEALAALVDSKELSGYFPKEVTTDIKGKITFKKALATNLPEIDDKLLKDTIKSVEGQFSDEEKIRNKVNRNPRLFTAKSFFEEDIHEETDFKVIQLTGIFQKVKVHDKDVVEYKFKAPAYTPVDLMKAMSESEQKQQQKESQIMEKKKQYQQAKEEEQSKIPCQYADNCYNLQHGKCKFYHTEEEIANKNEPRKKPCSNGNNCKFFKQGTCKYYHPKQAQQEEE